MILTKDEEEKLRFERKIYASKRVVEVVYQRLIYSDVQERVQGEDIVKAIKTQRLRWYYHIRMVQEKVVKKGTEWKPDFR